MNRKKRIELILSKNFSDYSLEVSDISILHKNHNNFDGKQETHFSILLHPNNHNIESKISIHRKINKLLEEEFKLGLHALEIKIID